MNTQKDKKIIDFIMNSKWYKHLEHKTEVLNKQIYGYEVMKFDDVVHYAINILRQYTITGNAMCGKYQFYEIDVLISEFTKKD